MATADIDLDYRERVLSRLWNEPDGMTLHQLQDTFPAWRLKPLYEAIYNLVARGLIVEVSRVHGTDQEHLDHARLMVLRERRAS